MTVRAPTLPTPTLTAATPAPAAVRALVVLAIATSSVVMKEPAPCDVLFLPLAAAAVFLSRIPLSGYGFVATAGALLLILANLISSTFAWLPPARTFRYMAITFYMIASFYLYAGLIARHGEQILRPLLRAFLFAAALASVVGILARFHLVPNPEIFFRDESGMRIKSTFKDPNVFAPFVACAILVSLEDLATGARRVLPSLALLSTYGLAVLFAFSRGAFLNLGVALVVYALLRLFVLGDPRARARLVRVGLGASVVLVPLAIWALAASGLADYFAERLSFQGYDQDRFGAQRQAIDVSGRNLLGIGPGNWTQPRYETDTHNVYLRVLSENGLLGLVGFLIFCLGGLLCAARGLLASSKSKLAGWHAVSVASVAGILVESMVIDTLHWRHLFLFLAIPAGLVMHARQEERG